MRFLSFLPWICLFLCTRLGEDEKKDIQDVSGSSLGLLSFGPDSESVLSQSDIPLEYKANERRFVDADLSVRRLPLIFVSFSFVGLVGFNSSWSISLSDEPIISEELLFDSISFKSTWGNFSEREQLGSGWTVGDEKEDDEGR